MFQIGTGSNAPLGSPWTTDQQLPGSAQGSSGLGTFSQGRPDGVSSLLRPGLAPGGLTGLAGGVLATGAGSTSFGGGFSGVMALFYNAVSNVFAALQAAFTSTGGASGTPGSFGSASERGYTNATASSQGDPHLAFDGTTAAGAAQHGKWDDMHAHADLIDSDSFDGDYRVSTRTTAPTASGVTYNKSATVTTEGGATAVTLRQDGTLSVRQNGSRVDVARGQSLDLGNGETLSSSADGSATIAQTNSAGGSITTTLRSNGAGVDVSTAVQNADLGGYLVTGRDAAPQQDAYGPAAASGYAPIVPQPAVPSAGFTWSAPADAGTATMAENGTSGLAGFPHDLSIDSGLA